MLDVAQLGLVLTGVSVGWCNTGNCQQYLLKLIAHILRMIRQLPPNSSVRMLIATALFIEGPSLDTDKLCKNSGQQVQ